MSPYFENNKLKRRVGSWINLYASNFVLTLPIDIEVINFLILIFNIIIINFKI